VHKLIRDSIINRAQIEPRLSMVDSFSTDESEGNAQNQCLFLILQFHVLSEGGSKEINNERSVLSQVGNLTRICSDDNTQIV